ncbi:putative F-box protein At3g52320 [Dioscorea cayenensis subsp. rotundata]|uniref:F-box protein At3g52320 n=1 Tax=Dioscorea cayennensis subsp. rotundata TaxID=55577 RepID=A0AB40ALY2_DIOCR|nr:putative F-box protein At3g52320 [Dioscorea cayenensis subsp. rotundata]
MMMQKLLSEKSTCVLEVITMMKNMLHMWNKPDKKKSVINEDIVTEILLRLPAKSIYKFKCVSKTWLKIITDPWFGHAYNSSNGLPVLAGFFHADDNCDLIFNPVNHQLLSPSLNHAPLNLLGLSTSSNGFLLLCITDGQKIVYNPVTRRRLMIPKMKGNQEWIHAFGLIHEKDNHVKAVFAYKLVTDDIQTALKIDSFTRDNKIVELPKDWPEMLVKWQCMTKNVEFRVYCSKKNEWNSKRLVSKFPRYVCFQPEHKAGVSIGGNLYWMTMDGAVLSYNSESETAELISAPASSAGLDAKSMHCSANEILVYCARERMTEEVVIWELSDRKTWVAKERVKLHGLKNFHLVKILYVCHEMQAVFVQTLKAVYRFGVSENEGKQICTLRSGVRMTPYLMSPWPASLIGDEAWPSSSSSSKNKNSGSTTKLKIHYHTIHE